MSGKSPQSTVPARAWAVRASRTANANRDVILMGVPPWKVAMESSAIGTDVTIKVGHSGLFASPFESFNCWLTSAAGLLKRSDAPSCDSLWSRVSRARAAADRAAGGNSRRDGAGGVAASDRGISPQAQGISGSARGVRAGGQRLLELDCREAAGPQRQAARSSADRARRLRADPTAGLCRTEAAGGPIAIGA